MANVFRKKETIRIFITIFFCMDSTYDQDSETYLYILFNQFNFKDLLQNLEKNFNIKNTSMMTAKYFLYILSSKYISLFSSF